MEESVERELVSKIQTMRKEAGFEVVDRIRVYYTAAAEVAAVLNWRGASIANIVLADSIAEGSAEGYTRTWDLNGGSATITVVKA